MDPYNECGSISLSFDLRQKPWGPDLPPFPPSCLKNFFSSTFGATVLCVSWTIFDENKTFGLQVGGLPSPPPLKGGSKPPLPPLLPSSALMRPCSRTNSSLPWGRFHSPDIVPPPPPAERPAMVVIAPAPPHPRCAVACMMTGQGPSRHGGGISSGEGGTLIARSELVRSRGTMWVTNVTPQLRHGWVNAQRGGFPASSLPVLLCGGGRVGKHNRIPIIQALPLIWASLRRGNPLRVFFCCPPKEGGRKGNGGHLQSRLGWCRFAGDQFFLVLLSMHLCLISSERSLMHHSDAQKSPSSTTKISV